MYIGHIIKRMHAHVGRVWVRGHYSSTSHIHLAMNLTHGVYKADCNECMCLAAVPMHVADAVLLWQTRACTVVYLPGPCLSRLRPCLHACMPAVAHTTSALADPVKKQRATIVRLTPVAAASTDGASYLYSPCCGGSCPAGRPALLVCSTGWGSSRGWRNTQEQQSVQP